MTGDLTFLRRKPNHAPPTTPLHPVASPPIPRRPLQLAELAINSELSCFQALPWHKFPALDPTGHIETTRGARLGSSSTFGTLGCLLLPLTPHKFHTGALVDGPYDADGGQRYPECQTKPPLSYVPIPLVEAVARMNSTVPHPVATVKDVF